MTQLRWDAHPVANFSELVRIIPATSLQSPRRSVVPLIDFFRTTAHALSVLGAAISSDLSDATEVTFEYPVHVRDGIGKPSYTDVMVLSPNNCVAIEAKFTEPEYPSVKDWLGETPSNNRKRVLAGWLAMLNNATSRSVVIGDIQQLPYQLIHRAASACHDDVQYRSLIYLIFGDWAEPHYATHVKKLDSLLGQPSHFGMHVLHVPVRRSMEFLALTAEWDAGERTLERHVRKALEQGALFDFQPIVGLYQRAHGI